MRIRLFFLNLLKTSVNMVRGDIFVGQSIDVDVFAFVDTDVDGDGDVFPGPSLKNDLLNEPR